MSIPAAKGFEYGLGMAAAVAQGSESNDEILVRKGKVKFNTNRAGGLLGGITTGESIDFRVAFKPVSSLSQPQRTITDAKQPVALQISGRHDICVAPRAVAIVRAMAAITIIDQLLSKN
jgi:chorismate synthase